jgi:hypothetical protein
MTNSAGDVKELYYSNGGTLDLDKNKVTPGGGLREREAAAMGLKANLLPEQSLVAQAAGMATAADTGADTATTANMRNWMECVRSRKTPNADVGPATPLVALCMTIAAMHTGQRATDDARQDVVVGGAGASAMNRHNANVRRT